MTLDEARALRPGDRVRWDGEEFENAVGVVESVRSGGIIIAWEDQLTGRSWVDWPELDDYSLVSRASGERDPAAP